MRKLIYFVAFILAFTLSVQAKAEYFVVKNSTFGYEFSVPDRWFDVGGMASRMDYAYMARGDEMAGCTIAAQEETRFLAFQSQELATVVEREFDKAFFETQVPKMNVGHNDAININVHNIQKGSLGNGYAHFALVDYTAMSGAEMRAIVIASIYRDMQMVVSCQSKRDVFQKNFPVFMSLVGSITFKDEYRPFPSMYYRDFIGDDRRTWVDILWERLMSSLR